MPAHVTMPVRGGGGDDGSRGRRRQRWRQQRRGGVATVCRGQLGWGGRDGKTRRAYVNYYINLRMQVTPHVTVVKSSLCDLFARGPRADTRCSDGKTYHMLYLYMTQR